MPDSAAPYAQRALRAVLQLHSRRTFSGDGYGWSVCAECRQDYPCATVRAIEGEAHQTGGSAGESDVPTD